MEDGISLSAFWAAGADPEREPQDVKADSANRFLMKRNSSKLDLFSNKKTPLYEQGFYILGGRRDLNPRPPEPQSGVLTNWTTTTICSQTYAGLETECKYIVKERHEQFYN